MENLNAEQVKKALQGHIGVVDMRCEECPYNQDNGSEICIDLLITDALALINSQEQDKEKLGLLIDEILKEKRELFEENKRLTEENERLTRLANLRQRDLDNANDLLFKVEDEIERLKAQKYYIHSDGRIEMVPTVESVRADTVRKMQERLKGRNEVYCVNKADLKTMNFVVDQIAKEMLEGEE
jgi:septal ring factor EnvC (AmiA/AmiB activator)